jgi:V/A-type H+-transporting ATPase subunit F
MRISVIGDFDTIVGFRLAGIKDAHEVEDPKEAVEILRELIRDEDVGLIIITERLADEIRSETKKMFEGRVTPLLVEIPDKSGPIEKKVDPIKELIRKAVGVEIKF